MNEHYVMYRLLAKFVARFVGDIYIYIYIYIYNYGRFMAVILGFNLSTYIQNRW